MDLTKISWVRNIFRASIILGGKDLFCMWPKFFATLHIFFFYLTEICRFQNNFKARFDKITWIWNFFFDYRKNPELVLLDFRMSRVIIVAKFFIYKYNLNKELSSNAFVANIRIVQDIERQIAVKYNKTPKHYRNEKNC